MIKVNLHTLLVLDDPDSPRSTHIIRERLKARAARTQKSKKVLMC